MSALSPRERQVLELIQAGLSDVQIVKSTGLTPVGYRRMLSRFERRFGGAEINEGTVLYQRAMRERAQSLQHQAESRLAAIMGISLEAVMLIDARTGKILKANQLVQEVFGYRPSELVGEPMERLVQEDVAGIHVAFRHGFLRSARKRELGYHPPIFAVKKDGSLVEVAVALAAIPDTDDVMVVCTPVPGSNANAEAAASERRRS